MDKNNIPDEETIKHIKLQEDLIRLMAVLDDCIDGLDKFYYYAKTREMLELSTDN